MSHPLRGIPAIVRSNRDKQGNGISIEVEQWTCLLCGEAHHARPTVCLRCGARSFEHEPGKSLKPDPEPFDPLTMLDADKPLRGRPPRYILEARKKAASETDDYMHEMYGL